MNDNTNPGIDRLKAVESWAKQLQRLLVCDTHRNIWIGKDYSVADLRDDLLSIFRGSHL